MPRGSGSTQLIFGSKSFRAQENAKREERTRAKIEKLDLREKLELFQVQDPLLRAALLAKEDSWARDLQKSAIDHEYGVLEKHLDKFIDFFNFEKEELKDKSRIYISNLIEQELLSDRFIPANIFVYKRLVFSNIASDTVRKDLREDKVPRIEEVLKEKIGYTVRDPDSVKKTIDWTKYIGQNNTEREIFYTRLFSSVADSFQIDDDRSAKERYEISLATTAKHIQETIG